MGVLTDRSYLSYGGLGSDRSDQRTTSPSGGGDAVSLSVAPPRVDGRPQGIGRHLVSC